MKVLFSVLFTLLFIGTVSACMGLFSQPVPVEKDCNCRADCQCEWKPEFK